MMSHLHADGSLAFSGIHPLSLPIPGGGTVNAYLLETSDGLALVDCGMGDRGQLVLLEAQLRRQGHQLTDITGILVTHFHPDHYGQSGRIREASGARLYLPSITPRLVQALLRSDGSAEERHRAPLGLAGAPAEIVAASCQSLASFRDGMAFAAADEVLEDRSVVRVGDLVLEAIALPGHTPDQFGYYDRRRQILISGDHLLAKAIPLVEINVFFEPHQMSDYLASLRRVADMPVACVLPGHGPAFANCRAVAERALAWHRGLREQALAALTANGSSAFEVACRRWRPGTSLRLQWKMVGETLAHLELLVVDGAAEREMRAGVAYYRRA